MDEKIYVAWDSKTDGTPFVSFDLSALKDRVDEMGYDWQCMWFRDEDGEWRRNFDYDGEEYILIEEVEFVAFEENSV